MDYRRCEYEDDFLYESILEDKEKLGNEIDSKARYKIGQHYHKIKVKNDPYYKSFREIYGEKCAYCGVITAIHPSDSFEIDHFISKSQESSLDVKHVDHISNLIFSCRNCNQKKKDFQINSNQSNLNPDLHIQEVFTREKDYTITIKNDFQNNQEIVDFYKKLNFSSSFRRLDYLLLNLFYMKEISTMDGVKYGLLKLYNDFLTFRNKQGFL